jgi:hypothetical protein
MWPAAARRAGRPHWPTVANCTATPLTDVSRRDTTRVKVSYLRQLPLNARLGRRTWVHRALELRVADSRPDRALVADIVKRRHYLHTWPARPRTLILSYLATLAGVTPGDAGAAAAAVVALLPANYRVRHALALHPCEVLTLTRCWRADDLQPHLAPDLMPEVLRRVVRGRRHHPSLRDVWCARKLRPGGLRAAPRLLVTCADPTVGHDGALYTAAGAIYCGPGATGKLVFAWGLDAVTDSDLKAFGQAVLDRHGPPRSSTPSVP